MNPGRPLTLATSLTGSPAAPESAVWLVWGNREGEIYKYKLFTNWQQLRLTNGAKIK